MRLPWGEISQDEYEQICYELTRKLYFEERRFEERRFVNSNDSSFRRDITASRVSDILPGVKYLEKWIICPINHNVRHLNISDIESLKVWADEPKHELDYLLIMTPNQLSKNLEEWISRFNKFPIKKYKIKYLGGKEIDQLVCSDKNMLEGYFPKFELKPLDGDEKQELMEIITKKLLNFRSDLAVIDFSLALLFTLPQMEQEKIVRKISLLWASDNFESLKRWNAGWVLVRLAKFNPSIIPIDVVEDVSLNKKAPTPIRALAAHIYAWLAETSPSMVSAEVIGELADPEGDYFVHHPASKALSAVMAYDADAVSVIFSLAKHEDAKKRELAAKILINIAEECPILVSPSIVELLAKDTEEKVREKGSVLKGKLESFWEAPIRSEFVTAMKEFERKNYSKAQNLFSKVAAKGDIKLCCEARWWSAYCLYLTKNYVFALVELDKLSKKEEDDCVATSMWWQSICYGKMGKYRDSLKKLEALARMTTEKVCRVKISPESEIEGEELQALLFKQLGELRERVLN